MKTITIQVDVPDNFELNGERHNVEIYDDVDGFFYTNFSWRILGQAGEVVVTRNAAGEIVSVTRQDADGKILSVIAEAVRTCKCGAEWTPDFDQFGCWQCGANYHPHAGE